MKQKTAEALKNIKIDEFKTVLNSGKNVLGVLYQMESALKVTEISTYKNKYTIFINKFRIFFDLPHS